MTTNQVKTIYNDLNGILLLDKPSGVTSNGALQLIKKIYDIKGIKCGHTGSLDPLATGMLPVCFGEATKFSNFLLNSDKKYLVTMQLGIETDTGDLDGNIIASQASIDNINFNAPKVEKALEKHIGEISQIPPIYSAIKYNGIRLYKLARSKDPNIKVTLLPRKIKIYGIRLLNICNVKKQISLEVYCSKGTYIRSLIKDLAHDLGCLASVAKLRRIMVGKFTENQLFDINQIRDLALTNNLQAILLPVKVCLYDLPIIKINQSSSLLLQQGKRINIKDLSSCYQNFKVQFEDSTLFCLINSDSDQLLGVGKFLSATNELAAKRLVRF
jgi:tRNA pseudouridine55 synthase